MHDIRDNTKGKGKRNRMFMLRNAQRKVCDFRDMVDKKTCPPHVAEGRVNEKKISATCSNRLNAWIPKYATPPTILLLSSGMP
ncbi:hypothetical protein VTJ04DRAFT_97 [Mycothermus thermophilus]|uniref:uncharacterized protein n=1 Tax=Humicola insolens TaxID=85995 RepID=UPI0037445B23